MSIAGFCGRTTELTTLTQWIVSDRCRLVALLGMGGIGKTALSVKLAHQLLISANIQSRTEFDCVIWRSLRNAPPLAVLLADLIPVLSQQQDTQADLNRFMHYLQSTRCLVILDNLETIMQEGDRAGLFRADYEDYGELLRRVSESNHQSCLLFTSREKPAEVAAFEGMDCKVRSLSLSGSEQAAQAILKAKGVIGSEEAKKVLCDRCGNSPLALKIVATSIQDIFNGDISGFLAEDTLIFNGMRRLLDQQFERLSPVEKSVMYWLAINREETSILELQNDIVPTVSRATLLETLESLLWRSLIERRVSHETEKQKNGYTQQPVVMEYVTKRLIEQTVIELETIELSLFVRYALIKTIVKEYVRTSQVRLILQPIAQRFCQTFGAIAALEQQILRVLIKLRQLETQLAGYGTGNLINLCNQLPLNLTNYDFSSLTIRHAYFQNVNLHRVNFTHAHFVQSVFTQTFSDITAVAFSPDGVLLAIGEFNGMLRLWHVDESQLLWSAQEHTNWITSIAWSPDGSLLASSSVDSTVKLWNSHKGHSLQTLQGILQTHTNHVWSVSWSPDGTRIASGSDEGTVQLWDSRTGQILHTLRGHINSVRTVNWSPNGRAIATGSDDHTIKLWDALTGQELRTLYRHTNWIWSVAWSPDSKRIASSSDDHTVKLWNAETGQIIKTLSEYTDWVSSISWNSDGTLIATANDDHLIKLWNSNTEQTITTLQGHCDRIWSIAFDPQGQHLISSSADRTMKL